MARRRAVVQAEVNENEPEEAVDTDVLSPGWKTYIWGVALLLPFGSWLVVFSSSLLYYAWKDEHPNRAKQANRHGWLAWMLGIMVWGALWSVYRG